MFRCTLTAYPDFQFKKSLNVKVWSQKGQRGPAKGPLMAATYWTPTGDLTSHGITPSGYVYWNQEAAALIELAVALNEGEFSAHRALVTETGERTGRSPNDKYIVEEETTLDDINCGDVNVSTNL